jgi:hypothetical protein
MDNDQRIKTQYENSQGDSAKLFREILRVSKETGLDEVLAILGRCVTEKRIAWAQAHLNNYQLGFCSIINAAGICIRTCIH